jgi:hypothetical protein
VFRTAIVAPIRVHLPTRLLAGLPQRPQKLDAILIGNNDCLASVAAGSSHDNRRQRIRSYAGAA